MADERGEINFVKILFFASIAAAVYLLWIWVPIEIDDYKVITAMHTAANSAYARRTVDDVDRMLHNGFDRAKIQNEELGVDGSIIRTPLDVDSDDWTITIDQDPPQVTIDLAYDRDIVYPWLKKEQTVHFHHVIIEDLSRIDF